MGRAFKKIGVVADDVTGSNDIGIMFAKSNLRAHIFNHDKVKDAFEPADVVIIDTDSRFDKPQDAYKKVYEATQFLKNQGTVQYYKKTCSVFRGNIGPEFDAMLDALNEDFAVVVLGFPKNGRVTVDGVHYVHGKLLEESEFRNDPMNPMRESNLVHILQKQTKRKVGSVNYTCIEKGSQYLKEKLLSMRREYNYVILDVRSQDDLKTIAKAVQDFKIICGASAIAEETAAYFDTGFPKEADANIPDKNKGILIMAGSLMPQTKAQIEKGKRAGITVETLNTLKLFDEREREEEINRLFYKACMTINKGLDIIIHAANEDSMVLETKKIGMKSGFSEVETARVVSGSLAFLAKKVIESTGQRRVVIAGGDTSAGFCEAMGIRGMRVFNEIQSGLPSCITLQGQPKLLVLKSGSFGNEEFFIEAINHLKNNL